MKINFLKVGFLSRCTIKKVLNCAQKTLKQPTNVELSVSFLSEEEIKSLNNQHRGVDSVTDVLSFPSADLKPFEAIDDSLVSDKNPYTGNFLLGDVLICPKRAKEQAVSFGHSFKREVAFLALHGFLHLCGFDHTSVEEEQQMQAVAESILQSLNIKR